MTADRRTYLLAWTVATLLHVGMAAALLSRAHPGGPFAGYASPTPSHVVTVALLPAERALTPDDARRTAVASLDRAMPAVVRASTIRLGAPPAAATRPAIAGAGAPPAGGAAASLQPDPASTMTDAAMIAYRQQLQAYLQRFSHYPLEARRDHVEGVVTLHFVLDRDGRVSGAWIAGSSGSASLDDEALQAVKRAAPLPAIPAGWPSRIDVTLPVAFALG